MMKSFLEYIFEANDSEKPAIEKLLSSFGYELKPVDNSQSIVVVTSVAQNSQRIQLLKDIEQQLQPYGAKYNPDAKSSSIGCVQIGKLKILVKPKGKSAGTDAEFEETKAINDAIVNIGGKITILDNNGRKIPDIVKAEKVKGTPKADLAFINSSGKEVIWISHKKGKTSADFQNWGGISPKEIENLPQNALEEVKNFVALYKILFTNEQGKLSPVFDIQMDIANANLLKYAVYGKDSLSSNECGRNNVTFLCQGHLTLEKKKDDIFELHSSGHFEKNPMLPLSNGYKPKFASKTAHDRITYNINGVRLGIYPEAYHSKAKNLLNECKEKFVQLKDAKTPEEFIKRYCEQKDIQDFYHAKYRNSLSIDEIIKYVLA